MFVARMKLTDDWFLTNVPQTRRIHQFALYAASLAESDNLVHRRIKAATIEKYLHTAAACISTYAKCDPRKDRPTDKHLSPKISNILDEVRRLEASKFDNKREPYTTTMHRHLHHLLTTHAYHKDSLYHAFFDWATIGLSAAFRLSEYGQDSSHSLAHPKRSPRNNTVLAVTMADIEFRLAGHRRIPFTDITPADDRRIVIVRLTYTHQKNGNDGEYRDFRRNTTSPIFCSVAAFLRIFHRFVRHFGYRHEIPLAFYIPTPSSTPRALNETVINATLRTLAVACYNLDPQRNAKELQRWSSHSIRVGACVLLHSHGFSGHQIQFLLRWKSDSFMEYLRNIGYLQHQQNRAITRSSEMPHLF